MDYTAIGDTVNLSARLEGVNKIYGTQNIISETTFAFVKDLFECRELDFIRVKGRAKPLRIYSVVGRKDDPNKELQELLLQHHEALQLYRNKQYDKAQAAFSRLLLLDPEDPVGRVFQDRCAKLIVNPDLVDEKGIFNITQK